MKLSLALFCALVLAAARPLAQSPAKTVWDGVYTEAQAARGEALYKTNCGHCHRDNLTGGGSEAGAPPLVGPMFVSPWKDQPVSEVFLRVGLTMPKNRPDSLTPAVVADILAFVLKVNEMPAGREELAPDLEKQKQIFLTDRPSK
jgi:mono/diheme cytochrome c family protein